MFAQEFGSIMAFCHDLHNAQIIRDEIPNPAPAQAWYFPDPFTTSAMATSAVYERTYLLQARIFAPTSSQAYEIAEMVANNIQRNRYTIPLRDIDGTITSRKLKIANVDFQRLDQRVAGLNITWNSYYMIDIEAVQKIMQVFFRQE